MFHNIFGQHGERSLIWQLDYHPQDQFSVFAQRPTLQYSLLDSDCDHRRLLFPSHCERALFLSTESLCYEKSSMTFKYSPVFFNLSYEALRAQRLIVRKTTDRPKHQVYPDTLKYQCKLFGGTLRREENKFM